MMELSYGTGVTLGGFTNHIPDFYPPYTIGDFSVSSVLWQVLCNKRNLLFQERNWI